MAALGVVVEVPIPDGEPAMSDGVTEDTTAGPPMAESSSERRLLLRADNVVVVTLGAPVDFRFFGGFFVRGVPGF